MARIAIIAIAALALASCAATPAPTTDDATVQIVASTNVYGSIATAIGGEHVTVTSLISSSAQDPHSYEASAQDQLAVSKADLVIENGGGYDPFIDTLLEASSTDAVVVNASEASGLLEGDHDHEGEEHADEEHADEEEGHEGHDHIEGFNEHVWYSLHGMEHFAEHLAGELSELDAANAASYEQNLAAFVAEIEQLEATAESLHELAEGQSAAITEPVPLYLLEAAGFSNVTPAEFSEAIEEGTDVPPAALRDTLAVISTVALLAYNSQTASSETEQLRAAAEESGVPVVEFTETLPDGADYVTWMTDNLEAIAAALR